MRSPRRETDLGKVVDCCRKERQMTTAEQQDALYDSELQVLNRAAEALEEVHRRLGPIRIKLRNKGATI